MAIDLLGSRSAQRKELLRSRLRGEATRHPGWLVVERLDKVLAR